MRAVMYFLERTAHIDGQDKHGKVHCRGFVLGRSYGWLFAREEAQRFESADVTELWASDKHPEQ
jgi:hypothetical protein